MGWAAARPERTWAIEGAIGLGHLLARQLVPAGEQMLDIQPKVAGRVRLRGLASTGHRMSGSVPPPTVSISLSPRRIVGDRRDSISRQSSRSVTYPWKRSRACTRSFLHGLLGADHDEQHPDLNYLA
jgi:hypothetical protein